MMKSPCRALVICVLFLGAPLQTAAWNKAGHMVSGAIAYRELETTDAQALARVLDLLRQHPEYETRWAPQLNQPFIPAPERDLYLFMLAARWSDDVRNDEEFDEPTWHYVNLPFKPPGQPASVESRDPASVNILSAFAHRLDTVRRDAAAAERAVALGWIFHLVGDVHQPLHTTCLFTTDFPEGDRGGTRFYIRARPGARTIHLHKLWDDLILGTQRFRDVRNTAIELRARPEHRREALPELAETDFDRWARLESLMLAKEYVYRSGKLRGSTDESRGEVLPSGYTKEAEPLAERRLVLAGYRLADLLSEIF